MKETIYLTRDESNIIKGILILLIVLGHNHFLMDGEYEKLETGMCHYCPKGHTHSLMNDSDAERHADVQEAL